MEYGMRRYFFRILIIVIKVLIVISIILFYVKIEWSIDRYISLISHFSVTEISWFCTIVQRLIEKEQKCFNKNDSYCAFDNNSLFMRSEKVITKRNYYYFVEGAFVYTQQVLSKKKCIINMLPKKYYTGASFFRILIDKLSYIWVCGYVTNRISYFIVLDNGICTVHTDDKHGNMADEQSPVIAIFIPDDQPIPENSVKTYHLYDYIPFRSSTYNTHSQSRAIILAGTTNDESEFAARMGIK